jgi:hypothetical protein
MTAARCMAKRCITSLFINIGISIMYIMTEHGWRRIITTCTPSDDSSVSRRIQNGYIARSKQAQYRELAAMVLPEKYHG